jgi:hypothetical protein
MLTPLGRTIAGRIAASAGPLADETVSCSSTATAPDAIGPRPCRSETAPSTSPATAPATPPPSTPVNHNCVMCYTPYPGRPDCGICRRNHFGPTAFAAQR